MKRYPILLLAIFILMSCSTVPQITVEHVEDISFIHIDGKCRYLVLPIQDKTKTVSVRVKDADASVPHMDIRLAADAVDYHVPFELPKGRGRKTVEVLGLANDAICWSQLRAADEIDWVVEEKYRPLFHFTPKTAWMNDPTGWYIRTASIICITSIIHMDARVGTCIGAMLPAGILWIGNIMISSCTGIHWDMPFQVVL